jgi:phage repressor protein C with HTH and peptisase S24 domain
MSDRLVHEIERRMKALGMNALNTAKRAGLGNDAVRDILRGRSLKPSHDTVAKIAKALGCSPSDLTGERPPAPKAALSDVVTVAELEVHVAAGLGADGDTLILAAEEAGAVLGTFTFPRTSFREMVPGSSEGVRMIAVRGDSMVPTLWPGQRVMVDTADKTPSPPGVFVIWDGLGLVLKRVELVPGSDPMRIRISSENERYTAYERTLDEAHINGRVIGVWARM